VIAERLASLGMPIDIAALLAEAGSGSRRSLGRPQIARAMIARGHVTDLREAFDRWLGAGRPAFVPREGPGPADVIRAVHAAGGIASLAHPGKLNLASRIPVFAAAGLDAVEVFHPDHDAALVETYASIAHRFNLLLTGGSDFHDDPLHGPEPGAVTLPVAEYERLCKAHVDGSR
jgi:predicted metal-dependent phosphoesterase TrpH